MSNVYVTQPVYTTSTTTGGTTTNNPYHTHTSTTIGNINSYTINGTSTLTNGILTYSYPTNVYQTDIFQELKLSDLFKVGDFVKVKSNYLHDKHALKDSIGLVHACYSEFCIVIFDFKFYKIQAEFLIDAFDK